MKLQTQRNGITNQWLFDLVKDMNEQLNSHIIIENNHVIFPSWVAEGTCAYHKLSAGVEVTICDLVFKVPMTIERTKTEEDLFYTMHINCSPQPMDHFADGRKNKVGGSGNSGIYWASSDVSYTFRIDPEKKFQAIFISMTKEFLQDIIWDKDSPSHSCMLRDKLTKGCILKTNGTHECDLDNGSEMCMVNKKEHLISSSMYTSIGSAKYNLVQEIIKLTKHTSSTEKIVIQGDVLKILALFLKKLASEKKRSESKIQFGDAAKIMTIKKTIDDGAHFRHFSLEELAKLVGMSKTKMKVKFKEIVGTSVYKYYTDIRMQRAKDMLLSNPRSITTLAYEMGFKTVSHFSQMYKKHYGINPNAIIVEKRKKYF